MTGMIRKQGRRLAVAITLAATLLGAGVVARANDKRKLSKQSFEQAELLYRQAKFRQALAAYTRAMSHYRHPAYLFNIAQCHRQLGQYAKARFFYKLFLSEAPDTPNRAEVERFVAAMELRLAEQRRQERRRGRLSLVTDPPGAEIFINEVRGKPLGTTPAVLRLAPGQQVVVLRLAGFQTIQRAVSIKPGEVVTVREVLQRPVARRSASEDGLGPVTAPPGKPYHQRWWFWTGLSVAMAAVGAATYTGTQALLIQRTWDENRGAPADDPNILRRGKMFRTVTDVLIGVAAVSAGAAIIGAILVSRQNRRDRQRATILPSCGPTGCGLSVSGRF